MPAALNSGGSNASRCIVLAHCRSPFYPPAPVAGNNEDPIVAAALDRAVEAALADVRPRRSTRDRLMDAVSPLALMVGLTPAKTTPLILPDLPLASAA